MLTGGDGYTSFGKGKVLIGLTDGKLMANEVMAYVRKAGHGRRQGRRPHRHSDDGARRARARAVPLDQHGDSAWTALPFFATEAPTASIAAGR